MHFSVDYVVPQHSADGVLTLFLDDEPVAEFLDGVPEALAEEVGCWLNVIARGDECAAGHLAELRRDKP